jgi:hypothetical protein
MNAAGSKRKGKGGKVPSGLTSHMDLGSHEKYFLLSQTAWKERETNEAPEAFATAGG